MDVAAPMLFPTTKILVAANELVVGDNIGAATYVGKNCAVAQVLIPTVDGTKHLYQQ